MKLRIFATIMFTLIFSISYAHRGYFYIFNASNQSVSVDGVKGHNPHWADEDWNELDKGKKEIPAMSSDAFFITQSLFTNDDAIQEFKIYDNKDKSILNYFTIGSFGPDLKKRIDYIKNHVSYISQTPISSLNELATFYSVISTKEISDTTYFDDNMDTTSGGLEYEIHNLHKDEYAENLVTLFGINVSSLSGLSEGGDLQNFIVAYVWVGNNLELISFAQNLAFDMQDEFSMKDSDTNTLDAMNNALDNWLLEKYGKSDFFEQKKAIAKWYFNLLTQRLEPDIENLIKDDKKFSGIWDISTSVANILAYTVNSDNTDLLTKGVKKAVDIVSAAYVLSKMSNNSLKFINEINGCDDVHFEGSYLHANCKNNVGIKKESTLYYPSCISSKSIINIDNTDGSLTCHNISIEPATIGKKYFFHTDISKEEAKYLRLSNATSEITYQNNSADIEITDAIYKIVVKANDSIAKFEIDFGNPDVPLEDFGIATYKNYYSVCSLNDKKDLICDNPLVQKAIYSINF